MMNFHRQSLIPESSYANKRRRGNRSPLSSSPHVQKNTSNSKAFSHLPILAASPSTLPTKSTPSLNSILAGHLSPETRRAYQSDLRHFLAFLGFQSIPGNDVEIIKIMRQVTRLQASEYRDYMLNMEGFTAATVNRRLSNLNMIFEFLKEESVINKSPFYRVRRPKVGREGKTPALTREQAECILVQPDINTPMGRRDRVLLLLMFFCGLRRGEVVKVTIEDFFEDRGHVLLGIHGKGRSDKSDAVKIPPQIWPEIRAYIAGREGLIFVGQSRNRKYNEGDKAISPTRVYLMFQKYCRMAGIDPKAFSPHSIRTTFITLCLQGGADIRSVMYAARHSDPATTIRYDRARKNLDNHASQYLGIAVKQ